jgi:ketosteroid isomerase-like protein
MRNLLVAVSLLLSLGTSALAGPAEEALQVTERWTKAFTESDVQGIVGLYEPDALFLGTLSKNVVTTPEGVRKYFELALLNDRPRTAKILEQSTAVLSDTVVVITGLDAVTGTRDGTIMTSNGRFTFVIVKTPTRAATS